MCLSVIELECTRVWLLSVLKRTISVSLMSWSNTGLVGRTESCYPGSANNAFIDCNNKNKHTPISPILTHGRTHTHAYPHPIPTNSNLPILFCYFHGNTWGGCLSTCLNIHSLNSLHEHTHARTHTHTHANILSLVSSPVLSFSLSLLYWRALFTQRKHFRNFFRKYLTKFFIKLIST